MTEWDQPIDDAEPSTGLVSTVFVGMALALAWLLCIPFELCARLRDRAQSDPLDEQSGADWAVNIFIMKRGCNDRSRTCS